MAVQTHYAHSEGVAKLSATFASEFGMSSWGRVLGLLHDKGKEKIDFQRYIRYTSKYDMNVSPWKDKTHAYVGALLLKELYGPAATALLANPIMGHHAGLYDFGDVESKLKSAVPDEIAWPEKKEKLTLPDSKGFTASDFHHLIRLLYSCLVDADCLDTEAFMNQEQAALRSGKKDVRQLHEQLYLFLSGLNKHAKDTKVNRIRAAIQKECLQKAGLPTGFYSLTVPTGGGKTISSIVWAVNHALQNGKKRIIIAIPYTSIIVQTAAVLRRIFGEENVLEHHSDTDANDTTGNDRQQQRQMVLKLATENWDYPIIVTTNVRLFESMFSNKPSDCRKLHNLCHSVLILDEAQTLPIEYLQPIIDGLKTYQRLLDISVLFTTASMPALTGEHRGCNPSIRLKGIEEITELIPPSWQLHEHLRRVQLHFDKKASSHEEIATRLTAQQRALCVVNTRKDAFEIFSRLPQEGTGTIHLSRMMCALHLREQIEKIKILLQQSDEQPIRVVSTQLIEAGVDIDFPVVFRQEAGLDSILQAAGRCNREGKLAMGHTYVFHFNTPLPPGYISHSANACKSLRIDDDTDCFSPELMTRYFKLLYARANSFDGDKEMMRHLLYTPNALCFETAARKFKLITDKSIGVIVNWKDSAEWVAQIKENGPQYSLMKKVSDYTVNIKQWDFDRLVKGGFIEEIWEGIYWLPDREQYKPDVGLVLENHWLEELLIK